jgi:hypothetical protein
MDLQYLIARVEMLEGQARCTRHVLAALVATHPRPELLAETMATTWADLREELATSTAAASTAANWRNGATSAWNALQDQLTQLTGGRPPRTP